MIKEQTDPLIEIGGTFVKFILAALFGAVISLILFVTVLELADENSFWF